MPIDPLDWLTTAQNLATSESPSEADLRSAVSRAYYAVFHTLLKTATERFIGSDLDASYVTLYRSFDHNRMRKVCDELDVPRLKPSSETVLGFATPSPGVRTFGRGFATLHERRAQADYNPAMTQEVVDTLALVQLAEDTINAFKRLSPQHQGAILLYMRIMPSNRT